MENGRQGYVSPVDLDHNLSPMDQILVGVNESRSKLG